MDLYGSDVGSVNSLYWCRWVRAADFNPSDEENAGKVVSRAWWLREENESPQMDGVATGPVLPPAPAAGWKQGRGEMKGSEWRGGNEEDFLILQLDLLIS